MIKCVNLMSTLHGSKQALGGARTRKAAQLLFIWKLWKLPPCGKVWKNPTTVFPHLSTGLGKLSAPKRSEFPTVPTASATGYRFVLQRVSHDLFFCPVENSRKKSSQFSTAAALVGMQFLKNLNPCSFYSLATMRLVTHLNFR